jgi:hypothetical protein
MSVIQLQTSFVSICSTKMEKVEIIKESVKVWIPPHRKYELVYHLNSVEIKLLPIGNQPAKAETEAASAVVQTLAASVDAQVIDKAKTEAASVDELAASVDELAVSVDAPVVDSPRKDEDPVDFSDPGWTTDEDDQRTNTTVVSVPFQDFYGVNAMLRQIERDKKRLKKSSWPRTSSPK